MDQYRIDENASPEHKQNKNTLSETVLLSLHDLVHLLAGILLVLLLLFRIVIVSGPSMNATLIDGDFLLLLSNILCLKREALRLSFFVSELAFIHCEKK